MVRSPRAAAAAGTAVSTPTSPRTTGGNSVSWGGVSRHDAASNSTTTTTTGGGKEHVTFKVKAVGYESLQLSMERDMLDEEQWECLAQYCQRKGIGKMEVNAIHTAFRRTLHCEEHGDFTRKTLYHASIDFYQDSFYNTGGDYAAQLMLQTWFQQPHPLLRPQTDRRQFDLCRLLVTSCDMASFCNLELLTAFWASALQCYPVLPAVHTTPPGLWDLQPALSLECNTELAREILSVIHRDSSRPLTFLLDRLLPPGRTVSVRELVAAAFQHPALMFPVVQFQRTLRRHVVGRKYWLSRRRPARVTGCSVSAVGLPPTYDDIFDRVRGYPTAWVVTTATLVLDALRWGGGGAPPRAAQERCDSDGVDWEEQEAQLMDNVLPAARYAKKALASAAAAASQRRRATMLSMRPRSPDSDCGAEGGEAGSAGSGSGSKRSHGSTHSGAGSTRSGGGSPRGSTRRVESSSPRGRPGSHRSTRSHGGSASPRGGGRSMRRGDSGDRSLHRVGSGTSLRRGGGGDRSLARVGSGTSMRLGGTVRRPGTGGGAGGNGSTHAGVGAGGGDAAAGGDGSKGSSGISTGESSSAKVVLSQSAPAALPSHANSRLATLRAFATRLWSTQGPPTEAAAPHPRPLASIASSTAGCKPCALCPMGEASAALCEDCALWAAAALKDALGARLGGLLLAQYGAPLGITQPDPLEPLLESCRGWQRVEDPATGQQFYHSPLFDKSFWENEVQAGPAATVGAGGGSGGGNEGHGLVEGVHRRLHNKARLVYGAPVLAVTLAAAAARTASKSRRGRRKNGKGKVGAPRSLGATGTVASLSSGASTLTAVR